MAFLFLFLLFSSLSPADPCGGAFVNQQPALSAILQAHQQAQDRKAGIAAIAEQQALGAARADSAALKAYQFVVSSHAKKVKELSTATEQGYDVEVTSTRGHKITHYYRAWFRGSEFQKLVFMGSSF